MQSWKGKCFALTKVVYESTVLSHKLVSRASTLFANYYLYFYQLWMFVRAFIFSLLPVLLLALFRKPTSLTSSVEVKSVLFWTLVNLPPFVLVAFNVTICYVWWLYFLKNINAFALWKRIKRKTVVFEKQLFFCCWRL